jgi:hypothetical protein
MSSSIPVVEEKESEKVPNIPVVERSEEVPKEISEEEKLHKIVIEALVKIYKDTNSEDIKRLVLNGLIDVLNSK